MGGEGGLEADTTSCLDVEIELINREKGTKKGKTRTNIGTKQHTKILDVVGQKTRENCGKKSTVLAQGCIVASKKLAQRKYAYP